MGGGIYWGAGEAVNGGAVLEGRDRLYNHHDGYTVDLVPSNT